jgi:NADPH:quinone reductase-like Zn-dependent oxidoreductase
MGSPGLLDTFQFEHASPGDSLPSDCIQVQVKVAGVNFRDVVVSLGLDAGEKLGLECSGFVTEAGGDSAFKIGDRVSCFVEGSLATSLRCQAHAAVKLPDEMSFQTAAAFPVIFTTVYYSLVHVGRLQPGESILIHSGAGGLGQACIQLARHLNTEIFVTVGNDEKKSFLMDQYHIPEDHIFYSRNLTFASKIKHMTKGRGVDVIVNSLAGEALKSTWECIAAFGRFIETGKKDILSSGHLPMGSFSRGASFTGVDLVHVRNNAKKLFNQMMQDVIQLLGESTISIPSPLHVFDASRIESAFRLLESGKSTGKIVITLNDSDIIKVRKVSMFSF